MNTSYIIIIIHHSETCAKNLLRPYTIYLRAIPAVDSANSSSQQKRPSGRILIQAPATHPSTASLIEFSSSPSYDSIAFKAMSISEHVTSLLSRTWKPSDLLNLFRTLLSEMLGSLWLLLLLFVDFVELLDEGDVEELSEKVTVEDVAVFL